MTTEDPEMTDEEIRGVVKAAHEHDSYVVAHAGESKAIQQALRLGVRSFEHGYLMAKLGRENVCSLVKGDIETPNDIRGVVYVGLDSFGAWKNEVAKELTACGYTIGSII